MQIDFGERKIKTIFLDVRGTVLSPWDDAPMPDELCSALGRCVQHGLNLVIATATSLASTGLGFVIEPLLAEFRRQQIPRDLISRCLAYIESGTVAYRFDPDQKIVPLEGYEFLTFTDREKQAIQVIVPEVCALHGRSNVRYKFKPGQVNCYAGGPWPERRRIADDMNDRFRQDASSRLIAQVPSSRETIDVAVSTKRRMAIDYLARFAVQPGEVMIVGDSLQTGGNDEPLSQEMPDAIAVQVGEIAPAAHVYHAPSLGPGGVLEAITALLRWVEDK